MPKKMPERTCIGCRQKKIKKELVRIVRSPEGDVSLDATGKKSGRGAYICPKRECLEAALKGKRLQKNLNVDIPAEVIEELREKIDD